MARSKEKIIAEIEENWVKKHFDEDQRDFFIEVLLPKKPKYCLETGFCTGTSAATALAICRPTKMISVGLRDNDEDVARALAKKYNFELWVGDSDKILCDEFFEEEFKNGVDFYFVDGSHEYGTALRDMEIAYPFMNAGSAIIVDDFHSRQCPIDGVDRAVDKFIKSHELEIELVQTESGKGMALIEL